jgi:hypothetical protein
MTEEQANDITNIAKYLCLKGSGFPAFIFNIQENVLPHRSVNEIHLLYALIESHFSTYIEVQSNYNGNKFIRSNNLTEVFTDGDGFIKYQKDLDENRQLKVMQAANLYFNTETAKRHFENYDKDQKRLENAEQLAKDSALYTKWSMIGTLIAAIAAALAWLLPKR